MDWSILILTLVVGIIGIRYYLYRNLKKLERLGIPHTKPWPIVGNFAPTLFRRCSLTDMVDRTYRKFEEADYVGFYNLSDPVILVRSLELIKRITIKNFDHFVDHRMFVNPELDPLAGKNVFGLCGEKWKEARNLLAPAFTSSKMKSMFHLISNCAKIFTDHLTQLSAEKSSAVNSKDAFSRYTNDVIATCAYGISVDSMKNPENEFYVRGKEATDLEGLRSLKMFFLGSFPKIAKTFNLKFNSTATDNFFTSVVKETIDTRDREGITRPDMIQLMMETRRKKPGEGPELTIQDMVAHAFLFFFAGFDTTSAAMCFIAHEIANNEDVQKKLQEEVDDVMKKTNGQLTYEALNEMQYLDAVISEAMRLYPVAAFMDRVCVKKFELPPPLPGGKPVTIEVGQNVWLPVYSIHRDSKYFPDPTKFDPDRFMGSRKKDIDAFPYYPFGLGPRMCLGFRFALLEIKVMFFYILSKCHLRISSKMLLPLKFSKTNFILVAEGGFWLHIEPRKSVAENVVEH